MKALVISSLVAFTTLAAAEVNAQAVEPGRFAITGSIGLENNTSGDLHGGTTTGAIPLATIASLRDSGAPALPATLTAAGNAAQLRIGARSYDDVYGNNNGFAFEGTYGLGSGREVFAELGYAKADESKLQVGTAAVINGATTVAEVPVYGKFDDYKALSVSVGARQWFNESGTWQPYVAGRIGLTKVDKIKASFTVPDLNITTSLNNVAFYDDSQVVTLGLDLGLAYKLSENVTLIAETGVRYAGKLEGDDSNIGGLGLASINDDSARTYIPLSLKLRAKF